MNPQPDPMIGNIMAFIVIAVVTFYTYKAYLSGKSIDLNKLDNFIIGYVEESPTLEKHYHNTYNNPTKIVKSVEKIIEKVIDTKPNFESQQLYVDCIDALYALGMKKNEAKKRAKFVFSTINPPPTTIQDFLIIALNTPK
jgi:hypothetical protein